ncbi:MAG: hypothetical protein GY913_28870 [Proteobacteria bacterium]|nr:hypothetical protein [Pseudomonadota bacterium]MCP4920927.1 hypothetical protein [Pseudomonadota bacterium]
MFLLSLLTACDGEIEDCPAIAHPSVQLQLTDIDGEPLADALVQFSVDDGDLQDCESWDDGGYVCGWETEGFFEIHIAAENYEPVVETIEVADIEGCDFGTESIEVQLVDLICTTEEVPGVLVTVGLDNDEQGDSELQVFSSPEQGAEPEECFRAGDAFACALEQSGDLLVFAHDDMGGYAQELVTVEHDDCHPITEEVHLELRYDDEPEPGGDDEPDDGGDAEPDEGP